MQKNIKILHLEDNSNDAELIHDVLESESLNFSLSLCSSKKDFLAKLDSETFDLILSDFNIPGITGIEAIRYCKQKQPDVPVIVISGAIGEEQAIECLKNGATDYVLKDKTQRLKPAIDRALKDAERHQKYLKAEKDIHNKNILLSKIINSSNDGIIILNVFFEIILMNPAAEELFKLKVDHAIGKSVTDLFPKTKYSEFQNLADNTKVLESIRKSRSTTKIALRSDDYEFLAQIVCSSFEMDNEKFYTIITRNITEKALYENELRYQRTNLNALIESTTDAILMYSREGQLTIANSAAKKYFKMFFNSELSLGDIIKDKLPKNFRKGFLFHTREALSGKSTNVEVVENLNSQRYYFDMIYHPIFNDNTNEVESISLFARNITHQKVTNIKIREQALFLDQANDAISACDLNHNITFWNKAAENLFGLPIESVLNSPIAKVFHPVDENNFNSSIKHTFNHGEWLGEFKLMHKSGKELLVQCRISLIQNENKVPYAFLFICSDITQKKQIERQLLRSQRIENIGTLAGGVAHDLNNILSPIVLSSQLLKLKLENTDDQSTLETIEQSALRGSEIVKQILSFTRVNDENKTIVQIEVLIKEIHKLIRETFPKNIHVDFDVPENLPPIESNPTELHQVLLNLCLNARDAMPHGGKLTIEINVDFFDEAFCHMHPNVKPGKNIVIRITDTGTGMSNEVLDNIFDPFYTTKPRDKGTGLGLFTVHNIIKKHNGFISVFSKEEEGTTFTVFLPVIQNAEPVYSQESFEKAEIEGRGETILIIEDELPIRKIMSQILESKNFRVFLAENGATGLETYVKHKNEIDLIITDLMMPVMDGHSTIMALHHIDPSVKIIAVSGEPSKISEVKDLNIVGYIQKPFSTNVLLQLIAKIFHY